jgi:hypothetical protein
MRLAQLPTDSKLIRYPWKGCCRPSCRMARVHLAVFAPVITCALLASEGLPAKETRPSLIARSQVWMPTDVATMDIKTGPAAKDAFPFLATVQCEYLKKQLSGKSPKFACTIAPDDEVKVKFGGANGEVYAEVAATRLLWALGFGADRMYPVKVLCRKCPAEFGGTEMSDGNRLFDPATIERKMPGKDYPGTPGWSWQELETVDERAGGASRTQRDALKLLAVFIQHTDSKPEQQRLICLKDAKREKTEAITETTEKAEGATSCAHPFMLLNDVGVTFGHANTFNANSTGSMNFNEWSRTPIWKDRTKCVANLPKSMTGTLDNPTISEEGRQFLANLLGKLSDSQIHDLFEVSRVHLRLRSPRDIKSGVASIDDWVDVFKRKRDEIATRHCE